MGRFDHLYGMLPVWAQNVAVTGYGIYWFWLRFGSGFKVYKQGFRDREEYSVDEWQMWTHEQLTKLLSDVVEKVPFYSEHYTDTQKEAARKGDLSLLPFLEKDTIRKDPRAFLRQDISAKEYTFHTSGTTGTPIASIWTLQENRKSLACVRSGRRIGRVYLFQCPERLFLDDWLSRIRKAKDHIIAIMQ